MNMVNRVLEGFIITCLFLTACAPAVAPVPTFIPLGQATATPIPPPPTQTPTPLPATATPTLTPRAEVIIPAIITKRDRRFGIGGDKYRAIIIGAGSLAIWGVDPSFTSQTNSDLEEYQMTAKLDNGKVTDNCALFANNLCTPKYDAEGNPATYQWSQLDTLITTDKMVGQIWSIGNEPDWYPYLTAESYAIWYKKFYDKIKSLDPTAKIMVGGIHSPNPARITRYSNIRVDYLWQDENKVLRGWTGAWRDAYKQKYGVYPQVDIWDIHSYPDNDVQQAYGDRYNPKASDLTSASQQAITDISYFRDYLDSIGEKDKPLWITETGLLESKVGDKKNPEPYYLNYWTNFMKPIMEFMRTSNKVQRIMPFGTFAYNDSFITKYFPDAIFLMQEIAHTKPASIADMNVSARGYAEYINQHQDKTPPKLYVSSYDETSRTAKILISDDGQEKSGVVGFSWIVTDDENKLDNWTDTPTLQNQVLLFIPSNMNGRYLFIRAYDAAGNQSETTKFILK